MDYSKIDLNTDATKGFADISAYMEELGNLSNNMKAQQKLALLNHKVILDGLKQLHGLNDTLDKKVKKLLKTVKKGLEEKKPPFLKIFSLHIFVFLAFFSITIAIDPNSFNIGYLLASIGMGCATGVLNLMLLRERRKYEINNILFTLEDEEIEKLEPLHNKLAQIIAEYNKKRDNNDSSQLESMLKETIEKSIDI